MEVTSESLPDAFNTLAAEVGGLSLTMPLKEGILELVADHRGPVDLLHAANTVVREDQGWWLDNTDWWGVKSVLNDYGSTHQQRVWLLGAGATARSVIFALSHSVPSELCLVVRDPARARVAKVLADTLGIPHSVYTFDEIQHVEQPDWVISTVPRGQVDSAEAFRTVAGHSRYLDAAYDPWPTPLARVWSEQGSPIISGLAMLTYQALAQVRAFVLGDTSAELPSEHQVLRAMREAVGLDPETGHHGDVGE